MKATISGIDVSFPSSILSNERLVQEFPDWTADKIERKTGISERRITNDNECSSDLGASAAERLFARGICKPSDIDYLLFCTQTPDYFLPSTACILQDRLNLPTSTGALDFNLGCSGYIYGLGLAKALVETGQATNVLLITGETYSKFVHPQDRSVRALFGDAGTATLVHGVPDDFGEFIGPFVYGTDGSGAKNLIVPAGGMRQRKPLQEEAVMDTDGNWRGDGNLRMNGPEIFSFTLQSVPCAVRELLVRSRKRLADIDLFVFHQANQYMLEHLRKKLGIASERFILSLRDCGNTVSCTIPIALKQAHDEGKIQSGNLLMLVGFGVGYSWGATLLRWI